MCKEEKIIQRTIDNMFSKLLNAFAKKIREKAKEEEKIKELDSLMEKVKKGNDATAKDLLDIIHEESDDDK